MDMDLDLDLDMDTTASEDSTSSVSSSSASVSVPSVSRSFQAPRHEIQRRRNLAIISHPDSGKTTMTEKLLLYGGALQQAGAVRQKAEQRATQSDFMEIEQERGISISSTVMNFDYHGLRVNILGKQKATSCQKPLPTVSSMERKQTQRNPLWHPSI
jgi:Elongation factor Tu GTP binding domain